MSKNNPIEKPRVLVEVKNNIAFVKLNRAEKLNGVDYAMLMGLIDAAKQIRKDRSIRAVIMHGDGKVFSSGLDFFAIQKKPYLVPLVLPKLFLKPGTKMTNQAQDVMYLWRKLPVPVIAVTHGKCYGAALHLIMGADFRFSTPDCEFSIMEAKWGLIPDMGGMITWREVLRGDVLRELAYTARVIDAQEAKEVGLVTRVVDDPMQSALELVEELSQRSPDTVSATKLLINEIWSASIRDVFYWETKFQKKVMMRWNHFAATSKNFSKNPMEYKVRNRSLK